MDRIKIREMSSSDFDEVLEIEGLCHATPWTSNSFEYEIRNKGAVLRVAVLGGQVVGYICVRTILDLTHILNLSVLPEFRRLGIGSMLLNSVLITLRELNSDCDLTLEVRESNIAAIKLYEKFGFVISGRRRDYFKKPEEDASIMKLDIRSV
ncbi:MAG TPA: ribosomal-protein-alanine N-acetyltransferase [bacterium]|nr:ribosomal-protein-alanine N-acetyltransferase [bacterium]